MGLFVAAVAAALAGYPPAAAAVLPGLAREFVGTDDYTCESVDAADNAVNALVPRLVGPSSCSVASGRNRDCLCDDLDLLLTTHNRRDVT